MAKDLNTSNLTVVFEAGDFKVVREADGQEARLGAVFLDGKRLDGVYCELEAGCLEGCSEGALVVPAGAKKRDAYLKRWVAAQKYAKTKKGVVSSLLLLSLAACGGGGGPAVVTEASIDPANGKSTVLITSASVGAVVTIASATDAADVYQNVTINADGSGTLTLSFVDSDDVVVLNAASSFVGFNTIIVERGTVDFSAVTIPSNIAIIQVGSTAILTYEQFMASSLTTVSLRSGAEAGDGTVVVLVASLQEARDVAASSKVATGVVLDIDVAGGSALTLTVDDYAELKSLTLTNVDGIGEAWDYSIDDTAANLLAVGNAAPIAGASAVTVTGGDAGTVSVAQHNALKALTTVDTWTYSIDDTTANLLAVGNAAPIAGASAVTVTGGDAGTVTVANYTALKALTTVDTWTYSIDDTTANLLAVGNAEPIVGASAVTVTGGAAGTVTVANYTALKALTTVDTWTYSIDDTTANLLAVGNAAPIVGASAVTVTGGAAGAVTVAQHNALKALTTVDTWTYSITDSADNLMRVILTTEGPQTVFRTDIQALLNGATSVTVTDTVNAAEKALLDSLGLVPSVNYAAGADETAPTIAVSVQMPGGTSTLLAGQNAVVTFTLSEASTDFGPNSVSVLNGALVSWQGPSETGIANTYKAIFQPATNTAANAEIRVGNRAFTDTVGNFNADGADSNNVASIAVNTFTFDVVVTGGVVTFVSTSAGAIAPGNITFTVSGGNITFSKGGLTETVTGVTSIHLADGQVLQASALQLAGMPITSANPSTAQLIVTPSTIADISALQLSGFYGAEVLNFSDSAQNILAFAAQSAGNRTELLNASSVVENDGDAGILSLAQFTELRALTSDDSWKYKLQDTATNLFNASSITLFNAESVAFVGTATVTQANRVLTLNNSLTGTLSVTDTAAELAGNSLVGNAADVITLTTAATVVQAQTIAAYGATTLNWGPGISDTGANLLANASLFSGQGVLAAATPISVTTGTAGELTLAQYSQLKAITTNDDWAGDTTDGSPKGSYTLRDTPQNLVNQAQGANPSISTDDDPNFILRNAKAITFDGVPNLDQFSKLSAYFTGDFNIDLEIKSASAQEIADLNYIMSQTNGTVAAEITGTAAVLATLQQQGSGSPKSAKQELDITVTDSASISQGVSIVRSTTLSNSVDFLVGIVDTFAAMRNGESDPANGGISSGLQEIVAQDSFVNLTITPAEIIDSADDIADINAIIASTSGNVTATLTGTVSRFLGLMTDAGDAGANHLTLIVTDTSALAADLNTLLSKTTIDVNIGTVTTVTGTYAQIHAFYNNWGEAGNNFDNFSVTRINLTGGTTNANTVADWWVPAGVTLTVDASALTGPLTWLGAVETNGKFNIIGSNFNDSIISGQGDDTINGGQGSDTIKGGAGEITILKDDDGQDATFGDTLTIVTGSNNTSVLAADAHDIVSIDAALMADNKTLVLSGSSAVMVAGLVANIDANGATIDGVARQALTGTLNVTTDNAADDAILVTTGNNNTTVTGGHASDTITIDADLMDDNDLLTTAGVSNVTVTGLMADMTNTATGTVVVTLDDDEANASSTLVTRITNNAATTVTVNNGTFDEGDEIELAGTGNFAVNGVIADVDAALLTGTLNVTTDNAADDAILVTTGNNNTTVTGGHASDTITIDATLIANNVTLTLGGASKVFVDNIVGDINAASLTGELDIDTDDNTTDGTISIVTGSNNTTISGAVANDAIVINAEALEAGKTLTTDGTVSSTTYITNLAANLINSMTSQITAYLDRDNFAAGAAQITITSSTAITIDADGVATEGFADDDTITLAGNGNKTVVGLTADLVLAASATTATHNITLGNNLGDDQINMTLTSLNTGHITLGGGAANDTIMISSISASGQNLYVAGGGLLTNVDVTVTTENNTIHTGDGDDKIRIGTGSYTGTLSMGLGSNQVHVADGANTVNATISAAGGGQWEFVIDAADANAAITVDADQLIVISASVAASNIVAAGNDNTVTVNTTSGNLTSYVLDADVENWIVGTTGAGSNSVTLGANGQDVTLDGGADTLRIGQAGALTATGTLNGAGGSDILRLGNGANISGATIQSFETYEFEVAAKVTMTAAQHNTAGLTVTATGAGHQVTLTTAGTITGFADIETYVLASSGGTTFTQVTGNTSVVSGAANDIIITSGIDATRAALRIDLTDGGAASLDTIRIDNDGLTDRGNNAVRILNFEGGNGKDIIDVTDLGVVTAFANNFDPLNMALNLFQTGGIIEISSASFTINQSSAGTAAGFASIEGMLDQIGSVANNQNWLVIIYDGSDTSSNAFLYQVRSGGEGDGFDFGSTGTRDDSIELIGILDTIGSNVLTSQNFITA